MKAKEFTGQLDEPRIVLAIAQAEARSRGEIRVHVTGQPVEDAQRAGAAAFEKLGMTGTAERNGVLVFVAPASRACAVLGDTAVHERCGDAFWASVAEAMAEMFRQGRFTDGIVAAIGTVGEALERHFPRREDQPDRNELPDGVSRD